MRNEKVDDFLAVQKKWQAELQANGKKKYLGLFKSEKEAALVYNKKAKEVIMTLPFWN